MAGFWARFARRVTRIGEVTLLENRFLPILEVNAAYSQTGFGHPISICAVDSRSVGRDAAATLVALEFENVKITSSVWVEQVAWTQAARLARVWCDQNEASDWQALIARELARSLETQPDLIAYLAYDGDHAIGMMIASSDGFCGWSAGADGVLRALFARGAGDLGRLAVSLPRDRRGAFLEAGETARFEVFITGNSGQQSLEASR